MLIKMRKASEVRPSEITPQAIYLGRRKFLAATGLAAAGFAIGGSLGVGPVRARESAMSLGEVKETAYGAGEELTPRDDVASYNNFYEFGTGKTDPVERAGQMKTRPWSVEIDGEVAKPKVIDIESLLRDYPLEERIYRLRCVEAWSMVIPWVGIPLAEVIRRVEPTGNAKFVAFQTLYDPEQMPGQRLPILDWPYKEGLRLDEAMNPLAILAVGLYGAVLPNQNGAPVRLVVPWKYGFKSIKSIVRMTFTEQMPPTAWNVSAPNEYGFYANVNPEVDHPRWSQARERRIGHFFKQETLKFNGYAEEVAHLYAGMDLARWH